MQISLRKAAALQLAINEAIRGISIPLTVQVDQYEDAEARITESLVSAMDGVTRRSALTKTLYEIRLQVANANQESGVNAVLNDMAYTAKQLEYTTELASASARIDAQILSAKLEKMRLRTASEEVYGTYMTTGTLNKEDVATFTKVVQDLKKYKTSLSDKLLTLNVETKITLSPEAVEVLSQANLI